MCGCARPGMRPRRCRGRCRRRPTDVALRLSIRVAIPATLPTAPRPISIRRGAAFESAWSTFLAKRTEADFLEYRRHRASTAWKYAMCDAGCRLPTQNADGPGALLLWRGDRDRGHGPAHLRRAHGALGRKKFVAADGPELCKGSGANRGGR